VIVNAVIAGLIAGGAYLAGASPQTSIFAGAIFYLWFSFNTARAEIEELKLILDEEAPGWRERNAIWTSTWDWNRLIKRKQRKERRQMRKQRKSEGTAPPPR
jgi:hypothetical protein